jgi:hypothetical protein
MLGVLRIMSNLRLIRWIRVMAIAIPSVLLLLGLVWLFAGRYVPSHRTRLYQEPISRIQSIRISPGQNFPLVHQDIVLTDAHTLQEIMAALRSAKAYFPNHPATRWSCILIVSNASGESYVDVTESLGQGTILYCTTSPNGGLIFDTLQSTTMGHILEKAVEQSGQLGLKHD